MEDHGFFFISSFILGTTSFLLVPSEAQENGKTENTAFIIIWWHATRLQLIRRDALATCHHATIPRRPLVHRLLGSRVGLDDSDYDRLDVLCRPLQDYYNVPCLPTYT